MAGRGYLCRTDELPRTHPVRRMSAELRRVGRLEDYAPGSLTADQTGELRSAG